MNKRKVLMGLLTLMSILSISCKKEFLEIIPKGRVILTTTNDYNLALNSLDLININIDGHIPMGDEVVAVNSFFNTATLRAQRLFKWEADIYQPGEAATEMLVPMRNIYLYNTIINGVMESTGGTDSAKNSILGEALAGRAWAYFMLINYYGKPYNALTAAQDPGYPIITEGDATINSFKRASVQEVYDFMVNDLVTAIPKLSKNLFWRTRMSKAAGEALLAKIYMFMGKFNEALPLLDAAFADLANATIPIRLYDLNTAFQAGQPLEIQSNGYPRIITVVNNNEFIYGRQTINSWASTGASAYQFMLGAPAVALFGPTDGRNAFYSNKTLSEATLPAGIKVRKYTLITNLGISLPDMYLLRAECKARLNSLPGAVADLVTLRSNRMPAADAVVPTAIASDRTALVKFIFEERIREYALQGYRWHDMRRLSVDAEFSSLVGNTHLLYSDAGAVLSTFTLRPERFVLRFPDLVMSQNPGMPNNP